MAGQYLVLFDADRIKDYVFATGRLREIRGASEQVRQLTDDDAIYRAFGLPEWHAGADEGLIYAGGGAGAALFADEQRARTFCMWLERRFRRTTRSATLSAVCVPVADAPAEAQRRAAQALAQRKASRPRAEAIPGGGALRFCASDRLYPASRLVPEPDTSGLLVSESTAVKRLRSRDLRQEKKFLGSPFWMAFKQHLPEKDIAQWEDAVHRDQDLGDIGAQAQPYGYVALVYADGDGIGNLIGQVVQRTGFPGYQTLSQALTQGTLEATAQALAAVYKFRPPRTGHLPFEVITIGGDDVILICTAERGLAVACALSRLFTETVQGRLAGSDPRIELPHPVSASVGVVIAHDSVPIVQLERRAAELLKSAKNERRRQKSTGGWIDFHIVSTPGLDAIETVRQRQYQPDKGTLLTMRPYACEDAERLLKWARALRGFDADGNGVQTGGDERGEPIRLPNSKRADLYHACQGERIQASFTVLKIHTRLKEAERALLLRALQELNSADPYPFARTEVSGRYRTALLDLIEAMEFVAEEGVWR
jgi:hypothetical protein